MRNRVAPSLALRSDQSKPFAKITSEALQEILDGDVPGEVQSRRMVECWVLQLHRAVLLRAAHPLAVRAALAGLARSMRSPSTRSGRAASPTTFCHV